MKLSSRKTVWLGIRFRHHSDACMILFFSIKPSKFTVRATLQIEPCETLRFHSLMTNCTKNSNFALFPATKTVYFMIFMFFLNLSPVTVSAAASNNFNANVRVSNRNVRVADSEENKRHFETTGSTIKPTFIEYPGFQSKRTKTNHVRTRRTIQNVPENKLMNMHESIFLGSGNDAGRIFNFIRELKNNDVKIEPSFQDIMNINFKVTREKRVRSRRIMYTDE